MKKAALYARVSTAMQEKERTIDSQIEKLKKQILANGDVLTKEYLDDGFSGAKIDRPALDHLRTDLKSNLFDSIYFLNSDRIARDVTYQNLIIAEILKHKKQIIIDGKDYVHNPENKFTLTVLGAVAELERAKIIERSTRGKLHKLRQGIALNNGYNILGYDYIKKTDTQSGKFIINQKEAKIVNHIFKAYAKGSSWSHIIRGLEDIAAKTKFGRSLWDTSRLKEILQNHTYTGIKYYNTRSHVKDSTNPLRGVKYGKKVFKDKSEWIPVKVPSVITLELFNKAQKRIDDSKKLYRRTKETRLLTGLVDCGNCGRFFVSYFRTYKDKRRVADPNVVLHKTAYRCSMVVNQRMHSKKMNFERCKNPEVLAHLLENSVLNLVTEIMTSPTELIQYMNVPENKNKLTQTKLETKLKQLEEKVNAIEQTKKDTIDLYANNLISRETYGFRNQQLEKELLEIKAKRAELIKKVPDLHNKDIIQVSIQQYCESVKTRLAVCKSKDDIRELLQEYINKVLYNNTEVTIRGFIPINLKAYEDPDQTSDASRIEFNVAGKIKRGNKWMNRHL